MMTAFGKLDKKMISVLSIDFDVFCDMTRFMPGAMLCDIDWVVEYSRWSKEFEQDFKFSYNEFELVKSFLAKKNQEVYIAEDHGELYNIITANSEVEITNLDFHSDVGQCRAVYDLSCGNWMHALQEFKKCNLTVKWHQLHSKGLNEACESLCSWEEAFRNSVHLSHAIGFDGILERDYDIIFLCQSHEYSPPHMNHKFRELVEVCKQPRIVEGSEPIYHTYSERVEFVSQFDRVYIPNGLESEVEIDAIYDDEELLVVYSSPEILYSLMDCDPVYRGEVKTGYSSHGVYATLSSILELETDRGNATVEDIRVFLGGHADYAHHEAIWVTYDAQACFIFYGDGKEMTEGLQYPELPRLLKRSKEFVESIDLGDMLLVCSDMQGGYLYVRE